MEVPISSLSTMPIKSTRRDPDVAALEFDHYGLFGDRMYLFVEAEEHLNTRYRAGTTSASGTFLSQREDPVLTQVVAATTNTPKGIKLSIGGVNPIFIPAPTTENEVFIDVSVWDWNGKAIDQGEDAAQWASDHVGRPVRLVRYSPNAPRLVQGDAAMGQVGFADAYPLLVTSTASVAQVNSWLEDAGKPQVDGDRYRANIVLDGLAPFEEDNIVKLTLQDDVGHQLTIERATPCARCPIPDTNQMTGELRRDVRSVLGKRGRRGTYVDPAKAGQKEIFFGQNFWISATPPEGKTIRLDSSAVLKAELGEPNWVST